MPRRQGYKFYNTTALANNSIIPQQQSDTATAVTATQCSKYRIKAVRIWGYFVALYLINLNIWSKNNCISMIGVIAWAIVESENRDSWRYFVMHLLAALPILSERPTTFMSDRDKGLMDAEALLPLCICRACCCLYLKENFTTKFSRTLADIFWQIARSPTAYLCNYHMNTSHQLNPTAAAYLRNKTSQF